MKNIWTGIKIWMVNRHWKMLNFISIQENAMKIKESASIYIYLIDKNEKVTTKHWFFITWSRNFFLKTLSSLENLELH